MANERQLADHERVARDDPVVQADALALGQLEGAALLHVLDLQLLEPMEELKTNAAPLENFIVRGEYDIAHPRADIDRFIVNYRKAGGQIQFTTGC